MTTINDNPTYMSFAAERDYLMQMEMPDEDKQIIIEFYGTVLAAYEQVAIIAAELEEEKKKLGIDSCTSVLHDIEDITDPFADIDTKTA